MKILYVTTISNTVNAFLIPHIKMLINEGHSVNVAFNTEQEINSEIYDLGCKIHQLPFQRFPLKKANIIAYKTLRNIIISESYDLVHTHTPVASAIVRLACRNLKHIKVIYTAHGFHFYKGAPLPNWILYYPVEKWLAKYTDVLITINKEDYERAKDKFKARKVEYVPGVGLDLNKFKPLDLENKNKLRKEYGYSENDFLLIYVAELTHRKHQDMLIKVISAIKDKIRNIKLLLVGSGELMDDYLRQIRELKLESHIELLGFRKDVPNLMKISDIAVSSSRQEGLPVNVMEAMATGLPLVVTNCRGNRDLVKDGENGYVVEIDDVDNFAESVENLYRIKELREQFEKQNLNDIKKYGLDNALEDMVQNYISMD
jgi:glycosyltransferase EpsD